MWETGTPLWAEFVSEMCAMCIQQYIACSVVGNTILPGTKGNSMGWGWLAFGYGMSFFIAVALFGDVSAYVNPAIALADWILGNLSASQYFVIFAGDITGAFMGATLHWILYFPHFKTVPEPPCADAADSYLRRHDETTREGRNIVSFIPGAPVKGETVVPQKEEVARAWLDIVNLMKDTTAESAPDTNGDANGDANGTTGRTVPNVFQTDSKAKLAWKSAVRKVNSSSKNVEDNAKHADPSQVTVKMDLEPEKTPEELRLEAEHAKALALYEAALVVDKNVKLSVFATRPAHDSLFINFIQEFIITMALVVIIKLFLLQGFFLKGTPQTIDPTSTKPIVLRYVPSSTQYFKEGEAPYFIGIILTVLILATGGPTGFAANPARDFGPRLAHQLLPIPGKGSSEWWYGWIPFFAPLAGACAGTGIYRAIYMIFNFKPWENAHP